MALCKMRVRWPTTTNDYMAFNVTHAECGNVERMTQSKSYFEANEWFCNSPEGMEILAGEEDWYKWDSRAEECDKWRREHANGEGKDNRLGTSTIQTQENMALTEMQIVVQIFLYLDPRN
jgi:hypothetical protein